MAVIYPYLYWRSAQGGKIIATEPGQYHLYWNEQFVATFNTMLAAHHYAVREFGA